MHIYHQRQQTTKPGNRPQKYQKKYKIIKKSILLAQKYLEYFVCVQKIKKYILN